MRGGAKGQMKRLVIPWLVAGLGLGVPGGHPAARPTFTPRP